MKNDLVSDVKSILASALLAQGFWAPHPSGRFPNVLQAVITVNFSPNADALSRWITICKEPFLQEYLPFGVFIKFAYRKFTGL